MARALPPCHGNLIEPMPQVEFLYDEECPNVELARSNLQRAFALAGLLPKWSEHRIGADGAPAHTRGYGSPTVLVDGVDVVGLAAGAEHCCRIYDVDGRMSRAPTAELIAEALCRSTRW